MTPIQQMFLGVGGATKTYVDEVFSTYLYTGNASDKTITNGIDLAGEGGLTWIKRRNAASDHALVDTVRGAGQYLSSNNNDANVATGANNNFNSFTSTGFTLKDDNGNDYFNKNNTPYSSWSFRKAPGFFDIISWTRSGSNGPVRTLSHNLGCVPGFIMLKQTTGTENWITYHRDFASNGYIKLNSTDSEQNSSDASINSVSATEIVVGADNNRIGSYVAYLFAGGKSTTDKAVDFDGDDYLSMPVSNTDFDWGASDSLTIECFLNLDDVSSQAYNSIINRWTGSNYSFGLDVKNNGNLFFYFGSGTGSINTAESSGTTISTNTWYHVAVVKDGTTGRFFIDGKACGTFTWNLASSNSSQALHVGNLADGNVYDIDGELSNVRMTIGQALYTTNFSVPSDPLTTTSQGAVATNVKLLCCNKATTTGSTVAPGTITANGNPTVTTSSSIFDDSAAHVFAGTNSIIRTGTYIGNGSSTGPVMNLGWEAQWILIKEISTGGQPWSVFDSMRGIVSGGGDNYIHPNENSSETTELERVDVTPTGFKITDGGWINNSGETYAWMAIRRPDGYVGKPADAGTDVFAMDTGAGSSTIPNFDSGFPVDMSLIRNPSTTASWWLGSRQTQKKEIRVNGTDAQIDWQYGVYDSNEGWQNYSGHGSSEQSWMWKRGQSFDLVTYNGTGGAKHVGHSLGAEPDMMWVKERDSAGTEWKVYHRDIGPTNVPRLNNDLAAETSQTIFQSTDPTSTRFFVQSSLSGAGASYIAMLFKSVSGISKVSSYTGTANTLTITTGFQPRFLIIKRTDDSAYWLVLDTLRGWSQSSNDEYLKLNSSDAQLSYWWGHPTSTGFVIDTTVGGANASGGSYIYYAHA